jgi:hypothetical protein
MSLLLLLLWFTTAQQQPSPPAANDPGVIKGVVVDPDGKPVEGAQVYVQGDNDPPTSRPDTATTKANGEFVLDHVTPRKVKIHAYKDSDYYTDVVFAFNLPPKWVMPEVEVKPGQTVTGVKVQLMQKAGRLHLNVLDVDTKELVHGIFVQLCREDNPSYCFTASGPPEFENSVPVGVGISIKVSADSHGQSNYQWQYHDPRTNSPYFRAKSGETETMNIYVPKK